MQKGHNRSRKLLVVRGGKISISEGGENKYRFWTKIQTPVSKPKYCYKSSLRRVKNLFFKGVQFLDQSRYTRI